MWFVGCVGTWEIFKLLTSGVIGAVLTTFITHWLIKKRERAARKKYFLAFLDEWRRYFEKHLDVRGRSAGRYEDTVATFRRDALILRDDLPAAKRGHFGELVEKASNFKGGEMEKRETQEKLISLIDDIAALLSETPKQKQL